jgi:hypothetical protein
MIKATSLVLDMLMRRYQLLLFPAPPVSYQSMSSVPHSRYVFVLISNLVVELDEVLGYMRNSR